MFHSMEELYEDSAPLPIVNDDGSNRVTRSTKAVKGTIARVAAKCNNQEHDEPPRPSFDLHLYAHIDRSSLNHCVFTPVPHQTTAKSQSSQPISRKRTLESVDSPNEHRNSASIGHDNGELTNIIRNMDKRLNELTRTCNGLCTNLHTLTKMVTQLVNHQTQNTDANDLDDIDAAESLHGRSSSSVASKTTSSRNKRLLTSSDNISQRPTDFLCRLIRKAYSTPEIVAGITPDLRLDKIKETIYDRYFSDEPERFEAFWIREAHQSILGQARAQRCRDKKAGNGLENNQNKM